MTRQISNFLAVLSPIGGIVFYYAGNIDWFALFSFFVFGPVLLLMPRLLTSKNFLEKRFEIFAIIVFAINALGAIYAFKKIPNYDSMVHFVNSAILYFAFVILLLNSRKNWNKVVVVIGLFLLTGGLGVLWEFYQKYSDIFLGTHMFFDPTQSIQSDTMMDISFNVLGALFAAIIATWKYSELK